MATETSPPEHVPTQLSTTQHSRELCIQTIKKTGWGQGMDDALVDLIFEYVQSYRVASGGVICKQGERGDFMAFIVSGTFSVFRTANGKKQPVASLGPGDSFGEMALVDDEPRSASIEATEDSDI
ncbi:MAG: cyclic nucleotide-binding domain-containing protein, partial [Myxococcota bacterium]